MTRCVDRGPDGQHCCQFDGAVCQFWDDGCTLYSSWGQLASDPQWLTAPVGRWFARNHLGYECKDWPQNIPEVMAKRGTGIGLCCWEE